jgi:hypothetical protein
VKRWVLAIVVFLALVGCTSGEVKTASKVVLDPEAVRVLASGLDTAPRRIVLPRPVVDDVASRAGVKASRVRKAAPDIGSTSIWMRSARRLGSAYTGLPGPVREVLVDVACQEFTGQISQDEVLQKAGEGLAAHGLPENLQTMLATFELTNDLHAALQSDDPEQRVSAVLFCYTVSELRTGP